MRPILIGLICVFLSCCSEKVTKPKAIAELFESQFGAPPSHGATMHKGHQFFLRDAHVVWLLFEADDSFIESCVARGFAPISYEQYVDGVRNRNAPQWWTAESGVRYYTIEPLLSGYTYSGAFLSYNSESKLVCFYHSAFY